MCHFCATKTLAFFLFVCFLHKQKLVDQHVTVIISSSYHHNPLSRPHSEGNADTVPSLHRADHSITDLDGNGVDIGLSGGHAERMDLILFITIILFGSRGSQ